MTGRPFRFKPCSLAGFADVRLRGATLYDLFSAVGSEGQMDYRSPAGNRIVVRGRTDLKSLKRTRLYLGGRDNRIEIVDLKGVHGLDIACIDGSSVTLASPRTIRGMTVMCSHGSRIDIGRDCLVSRDVMIYASRAHGVYSVADGTRREKSGIKIGNHVWLGQGARILSGAQVGNGSIVGSYSVLAGRIPNNCAAAGNPCRVTSRDVFWLNSALPDNANYFDKKGRDELPDFISDTVDDRT